MSEVLGAVVVVLFVAYLLLACTFPFWIDREMKR